MSLAVIQNPLSPTGYEEALAFFFHTQQEGVVNLGVLRRSLSGRTDYDYRDYNTETLFPVASTSGLEVAFYNGAPRVFGFTIARETVSPAQENPVEKRITQLSPTTTPIDNDESYAKSNFTGAFAATYDTQKAYLFAIRLVSEDEGSPDDNGIKPKADDGNKVELVYYILGPASPFGEIVPLAAREDTQLAAVFHHKNNTYRYFYQSNDEKKRNMIRWGEIDETTKGDVPKIKAWENTPIAVVNEFVDPANPAEKPRFCYLYFVAEGNNRVYRTRYDYQSTQDEDDKWEEAVEMDKRPIIQSGKWIKVIPFSKESNYIFWFDHEDQLLRFEDRVESRAPARHITFNAGN